MPTPTLAELLAALKVDLGRTNPSGVIAQLGRVAHGLPESAATSPEDREQLTGVLAALRCIRRYSGAVDGLLAVELMTLGKLGRFSAAVRRARLAHRDDPTWSTAVAAGNALRRAGRPTAAAKMFAAAAELDPSDVTALLEIGDLALEAGRPAEALTAYERALSRERGQPWAEPSAWYCRYVLSGNEQWLKKLRKAANRRPDKCGVGAALAGLFGGYSEDTRRQRAKRLLARAEGE